MTTGSERVSSTWRRPMRQVGPVLFVDAPEQQGPWAVRQQRDPPRQCGDVVEVRVPGGDQVLQQLLGPLPHRPQRCQCVVEGRLLGGHLGIGRGSGHAHRGPISAKTRAKAPAQKSPDIPGTLLHLDLSKQALQLVFRLLVRLDFEPLTEGPYCAVTLPNSTARSKTFFGPVAPAGASSARVGTSRATAGSSQAADGVAGHRSRHRLPPGSAENHRLEPERLGWTVGHPFGRRCDVRAGVSAGSNMTAIRDISAIPTGWCEKLRCLSAPASSDASAGPPAGGAVPWTGRSAAPSSNSSMT